MLAFFSGLIDFLKSALGWLLDGGLLVLKMAFYWPFDGLLTCISAFFTALNFSTYVSSYALKWADLPSQMIYVVNAIGLPQGIALLLAAIGIRMIINLIPAAFTRV